MRASCYFKIYDILIEILTNKLKRYIPLKNKILNILGVKKLSFYQICYRFGTDFKHNKILKVINSTHLQFITCNNLSHKNLIKVDKKIYFINLEIYENRILELDTIFW